MQAQGRERYRMLRFRFDIAIMYLLVVVDIFFTVFLSLLTMVTYGWLPTARSATSEDDVYLFHGGNAREKALSRKASSFLPRAKRRRRRRRLDLARRISLPTSSSNHASSGKEGGFLLASPASLLFVVCDARERSFPRHHTHTHTM